MKSHQRLLFFGFVTLLSGLALSADGASYPEKSIRFVIPYPPGGSADVVARILGHELVQAMGQQVVMDNRGGATGIVALQLVARSAPDGYTIMLASAGPNAINPSIYRKLPYDPLVDFAPITLAMMVPQIVVVNPALNAKTIQELITLAKEKPGALTYASAGTGSSFHLSVELFKSLSGLNMTHVPYKGAGPALNDVVAGHVQLMFPSAPSVMSLVKSGRLRAIAVTTIKRVSALPDMPTVSESGVPGYEAVSWFGVVAPASTPVQIIDTLHGHFGRILALQRVKERFIGLGAEIVSSTKTEFQAYLKNEVEKWRKVVAAARITAD